MSRRPSRRRARDIAPADLIALAIYLPTDLFLFFRRPGELGQSQISLPPRVPLRCNPILIIGPSAGHDEEGSLPLVGSQLGVAALQLYERGRKKRMMGTMALLSFFFYFFPFNSH